MKCLFRNIRILPHLSTLAGIVILFFSGCSTTPPAPADPAPISGENNLETHAVKQNQPAPPAVTGPIDLDTAIKRAITYSDDVTILRATSEVANQQKFAARGIQDPELRISQDNGNSSRTRTYSDIYVPPSTSTGTSDGNVAGIRFSPPNPWEFSARVSGANADYYAAIADVRHQEWLISIEVRRLFAEIQYLENDIQLIDQLVGVYKDLQDVLNQSINQGQATMQDVATASRRYLRMLSVRNDVIRSYEESHRLLADITAISPEHLQLVFDSNTLTSAGTALNKDVCEQEAMQNRADLSAAFWRTESARQICRAERKAKMPWLTFVQFSYASGSQLENTSEIDVPTGIMSTSRDDTDSDEWRVDMGISIPILSWLNHDIEASDAEYNLTKTEETMLLKKIHREIDNSLSAMKSIKESQSLYQQEISPVIEQMQDVLEKVEANSLEPDEAARIKEEIIETQRLQIKADYEYALAVLKLESVLGIKISESEAGQ